MISLVKLNKRIHYPYLILSLFISFYSLVLEGKILSLNAYYDSNSQVIKILCIQLFLIISMILSLYYLINTFFLARRNEKLLMGILSVIVGFISYHLIVYDGLTSYIAVGDYLRDTHNINIFWMDWSGWVVGGISYLMVIITGISVKIIKQFSN